MNLWPQAPCPGNPQYVAANDSINGPPSNYFTDSNGVKDGIYNYYSTPLQTIREDFGTARLDHTFSSRDSASAVYTIDDSYSNTATVFNPLQHGPHRPARTGLQPAGDARFSPNVREHRSLRFLSRRIFFHRRAYSRITRGVANGTRRAIWPACLVGALVVGGSQASNPQRSWDWREQQRQQPEHGPKYLHVHGSGLVAPRAAPIDRRRLVPTIPVQRRDRAQPIRPVDIQRLAGV